VQLEGGAELFVTVEIIPDIFLPKRVEGSLLLDEKRRGDQRAVYVVAREWDGGKVITSPIFFDYT
jgi:hypothetical protein